MPRQRIVDDSQLRPGDNYFGNQWARRFESNLFNRSSLFCETAFTGRGGQTPHFKFEFSGPDLKLFGESRPRMTFNYTLDGDPVAKAAVLETVAQNVVDSKEGALIWKLENLGWGPHSVQLWPQHGNGLDIDYLTYTLGDELVTPNQTLYHDSNDRSLVSYEGEWTEEAMDGPLVSAAGPEGFTRAPMNGRWARTTVNGSSFKTSYTGNQVLIYGYLHHVPGVLRVQYEWNSGRRRDGTYPVLHFNGSQPTNRTWSYVELYKAFPRSTSERTLTVTVLNMTGEQSFNFDFMTYRFDIPEPGSKPPKEDMKVAIATPVAAIGGFVLLMLVVWTCHRRRQRQRYKEEAEAQSRGVASERHRLPLLSTQGQHFDWEGPTAEPAPPPWSPPGATPVGDTYNGREVEPGAGAYYRGETRFGQMQTLPRASRASTAGAEVGPPQPRKDTNLNLLPGSEAVQGSQAEMRVVEHSDVWRPPLPPAYGS